MEVEETGDEIETIYDPNEDDTYMAYRSLCIPKNFFLRRWANYIYTSQLYKAVIITIIVLNCVLLAFWDPLDPEAKDTRNQTIIWLDFAFLILYTIEVAFTIFVRGLFWHKKSYLRDPWSYLDLVIVTLGWIAIIITRGSGVNPLRALQALRPLRIISNIPHLRRIIDGMLVSLPFLVGAFMLMSLFFIVYGILGVLVFNGEFRYHCVVDDDFDENLCCNDSVGILGGLECGDVENSAGECRLTDENIDFGFFNYDNIFNAWIAIYLIINVEGWSRWAYITIDATNDLSAFYYIAAIILGSIFWLNLLLAVISVSVGHLPPPITLEVSESTRVQKIINRFQRLIQRHREPNLIYQICYKISTNKYFNIFMFIVISINLIALAMPFRYQPTSYTIALLIINFVCLVIFTIEMFIHLIGGGIYRYFSNPPNWIDFIVVVTGWIEILFLLVSQDFFNSSDLSVLRVLRALRLLRMLKLARKWKGLRFAIESVIIVLPTIFSFTILVGIVTVVFMLVGIQLFGGQMRFDGVNARYNFDNLYWAYISLFVVTTGEQWPSIFFSGMRVHFWAGLIYFVLWKSISTYLLLNLFLALLIDSFKAGKRKREEKYVMETKKPPEEFPDFWTVEDLDNVDDNPPDFLEHLEISGSSDIELDNLVEEREPLDESKNIEILEGALVVEEDTADEPEIHDDDLSMWDRLLANPFGKERPVAPVIFGCISENQPPRKQIISVVQHPVFESFIILIVILSCIELVIFDPGYDTFSVRGWIIFSTSLTFACIFTCEMILRMITYGIIKPPGAYFRNGWDIIDFFVVVISWVAIGLSFVGEIQVYFLAFRALRAIRILSRFAGTRLVVQAVLESVQVIPHILAISFFFWILFAIAGLQLFVGQYYYCEFDGAFTDEVDDKDSCKDFGGTWEHWPSYFANFFVSLVTVVRAASVNFPDPLIHSVDVAGVDQNPIRDNHPEYAIYWVIFYIICSWFVLGLFIGSIVDVFNAIREKKDIGKHNIFVTDKQREWIQLHRVLASVRPIKTMQPGGNSFIRLMCFEIVESKQFDIMIFLTISVAIAAQCTFHFQQPWTWELLQTVTNLVVTAIFIFEMSIKFVGYGIRGYFSSHWNKFDFFVVVVSVVDIIALAFGLSSVVLEIVIVLRVSRILRFFRIIYYSKRLQVIIKSCILSAKTIANVLLVLIIFFYIYAVIGVAAFYDLPQSDDINDPVNRTANWEDFFHSLFMCTRLATGEAWDLVQAKVMEEKPVAGILWFFSFIFTFNLIFVNLIVASLYENLSVMFTFTNFSKSEQSADINAFIKTWRHFDPFGTKFIAEEDFPKLLMKLEPPLGVGPVRPEVIAAIIEEYDIPVTRNGQIFFPDVLLAVSERICEFDYGSELITRSVANQWKKAYPHHVEVVKGRRRLVFSEEEEKKTRKFPFIPKF